MDGWVGPWIGPCQIIKCLPIGNLYFKMGKKFSLDLFSYYKK